jgi:GNAT superfamily N-acetyltransferase
MTSHQPVPAEEADVERLSEIIAESFAPLAPSLWLIPDPQVRRELFPGYFRIYVEDAMANGTVYTTEDRTGVALWITRTEAEAPHDGDAQYDARLAAATGAWIDRFRTFDAILDKNHPSGTRHDHLAILGVDPRFQHQGVGTGLLEAHHAVLDRDGVAGYLEAGDAGTRTLYLKHGYADLGEPIRLPDDTPMYPMWRPAG